MPNLPSPPAILLRPLRTVGHAFVCPWQRLRTLTPEEAARLGWALTLPNITAFVCAILAAVVFHAPAWEVWLFDGLGFAGIWVQDRLMRWANRRMDAANREAMEAMEAHLAQMLAHGAAPPASAEGRRERKPRRWRWRWRWRP